MSSALIGYTGFVGSNIGSQYSFTDFYNSKNIKELIGKEYDLVVCAGVPAVKWWANENPEEDFEVIRGLVDIYSTVKAKCFVLISTVDVYPYPREVDEESLIDTRNVSAYGRNRFWLEKELNNVFPKLHVIRLPALFGPGLKKNVLFDMLNNNILDKINPESSFQWYPLARIWQDIKKVIELDLNVVNFSVEPIKTSYIHNKFFSELDIGSSPFAEVHYDMRSVFARDLGSHNKNYLVEEGEVLLEMESWLNNAEQYND